MTERTLAIDFEHWANLARNDPAEFARQREQLIQQSLQTGTSGQCLDIVQLGAEQTRLHHGLGMRASQELLSQAIHTYVEIIDTLPALGKAIAELEKLVALVQQPTQTPRNDRE